MLYKSIKPHILQCISTFDTPTAEQRGRLTAEDIAGPLEVLFEFGEMETVGAVDPILKPLVFFGEHTAYFGISENVPGWEKLRIRRSMHAVLEGFEPSTGLRFKLHLLYIFYFPSNLLVRQMVSNIFLKTRKKYHVIDR
jgi:hypothetical protein